MLEDDSNHIPGSMMKEETKNKKVKGIYGEENGKPLQYSCLENPMDREAWWATVYGVAKSRTQLSD